MKSVPPAVVGGYSLTIGPHKTPHICSQSGDGKGIDQAVKGQGDEPPGLDWPTRYRGRYWPHRPWRIE